MRNRSVKLLKKEEIYDPPKEMTCEEKILVILQDEKIPFARIYEKMTMYNTRTIRECVKALKMKGKVTTEICSCGNTTLYKAVK